MEIQNGKEQLKKLCFFKYYPETLEEFIMVFCILMGESPSIAKAKEIIGGADFNIRLERAKKIRLSDENLERCKNSLGEKEMVDEIKYLGNCAETLVNWSEAMYNYHNLSKQIRKDRKTHKSIRKQSEDLVKELSGNISGTVTYAQTAKYLTKKDIDAKIDPFEHGGGGTAKSGCCILI